jgi:hypothetical protein
MSGAVPLRSIYALMASTGTTTFAWAITLTKGTECETDEETMERTNANVKCCLACTEYVKMKGEEEMKYTKREKEWNEKDEEEMEERENMEQKEEGGKGEVYKEGKGEE